jgi:hypothetical protein
LPDGGKGAAPFDEGCDRDFVRGVQYCREGPARFAGQVVVRWEAV